MRWYPRFRHQLANGPHVLHTQCHDIGEAVDYLAHKGKVRRMREAREARNKPLSLRQEFALNKAHQNFKNVTLSDRVATPKDKYVRPKLQGDPPPKPAGMRAKRARAVELYETGYWKPHELAREVGADIDKVKKWLRNVRVYR